MTKYDLKAMDYDPDYVKLPRKFTWKETPEGLDYWLEASVFYKLKGYYASDVQEKLDAMQRQYEEETALVNEPKYILTHDDGSFEIVSHSDLDFKLEDEYESYKRFPKVYKIEKEIEYYIDHRVEYTKK